VSDGIIKRPMMRTAPCAVVCRGDGASIGAIIDPAKWPHGGGVAGFGDTLPDALRDLATEIEKEVNYDSKGANPQFNSYLRITRVCDPIWAMTSPEGMIGLRLDCGDGGVINFTKEQAREVIDALSSQLSK